METYANDTIRLAKVANIQEKFVAEVERLLLTHAIPLEEHNRGIVFGVALENIADGFLRENRRTKEYKNLKRF